MSIVREDKIFIPVEFGLQLEVEAVSPDENGGYDQKASLVGQDGFKLPLWPTTPWARVKEDWNWQHRPMTVYLDGLEFMDKTPFLNNVRVPWEEFAMAHGVKQLEDLYICRFENWKWPEGWAILREHLPLNIHTLSLDNGEFTAPPEGAVNRIEPEAVRLIWYS